MPAYAIRSHRDRHVIFAGEYPDLRRCAEAAVDAGRALTYADFAGANLAHVTLDGADLRYARFDGADLTGANLSEADLTGASLRGTDATLACLAESRLIDMDCTDATFTGAHITGAVMEGCRFSTPSALALPFDMLQSMGTQTYAHDNNGTALPFAACPIVITGLGPRIVRLDRHILIGNALRPDTPAARHMLDQFLAGVTA
ncbi:MAG: pentapeptide repeat-containing protein [Alphaproteobacteria bacterium]|nr:pentapeptide repeat-containing protein [Alphaproteobacteria bacterium]USO07994.1 MAG: pentapeptide repeat-containing protein [Rhodospirillales bacterium]